LPPSGHHELVARNVCAGKIIHPTEIGAEPAAAAKTPEPKTGAKSTKSQRSKKADSTQGQLMRLALRPA